MESTIKVASPCVIGAIVHLVVCPPVQTEKSQ